MSASQLYAKVTVDGSTNIWQVIDIKTIDPSIVGPATPEVYKRNDGRHTWADTRKRHNRVRR